MIKLVFIISRKLIIFVVSWVCIKVIVIKMGMKVFEVLSLIIMCKNIMIKVLIGINMMVLNMVCFLSGKLWIERLSKLFVLILLLVVCWGEIFCEIILNMIWLFCLLIILSREMLDLFYIRRFGCVGWVFVFGLNRI